MKKIKADIERKYDSLLAEVKYRSQCKLMNKKKELLMKYQDEAERKYSKFERKILAFIKKKEVEYDRKCKNEIRKLEGKPEREYKKKKKSLNLVEFAMELMQENARLRDSDREGKGFCISCDKLVSWGNHAGGHDFSRKVKNICLCTWNINLQCNGCNRTTGPRGDKIASERVNRKYDENLTKKYGWEYVKLLREHYEAYFKKDYDENWLIGDKLIKKAKVESYLVEEYIPELIKENELRWTGKDFKGKKNRRKIWEEYLNS